jgi:hypothetical protein
LPCKPVPQLDVQLYRTVNSWASAARPAIPLARICICLCATPPTNRWIRMDGEAAAQIRGSTINPNHCGWRTRRFNITEPKFTRLARHCHTRPSRGLGSSSMMAPRTTQRRRLTAGTILQTAAPPAASSAILEHGRARPRAQRSGSSQRAQTMVFILCMCVSQLCALPQKERCIPSATQGNWIRSL